MIRPRVVISTFGSLGDLNPYVAIALELRHRGYEPVIATTPLYRDKITSLGLWFHPVRPDLPSYDRPEDLEAMVRGAMDPMTGIRTIVGELIMPYLRGIYDDLCQAVQGAALLLSHPLPLVAPIVAERTGVPWVSSVLAPMSLFSVYDPAVNAQMPWLHPFLKLSPALCRASIHLVRRLSDRMLRPLYALRAEWGYRRDRIRLSKGSMPRARPWRSFPSSWSGISAIGRDSFESRAFLTTIYAADPGIPSTCPADCGDSSKPVRRHWFFRLVPQPSGWRGISSSRVSRLR
ncbi:MAG: glycosyltransferase [Chromatiales bacterium]